MICLTSDVELAKQIQHGHERLIKRGAAGDAHSCISAAMAAGEAYLIVSIDGIRRCGLYGNLWETVLSRNAAVYFKSRSGILDFQFENKSLIQSMMLELNQLFASYNMSMISYRRMSETPSSEIREGKQQKNSRENNKKKKHVWTRK
jgi:hypothetical protein